MRDEIMSKCLKRAKGLLDKETAPTVETAEAVRRLVETAIMINRIGNDSPIGPGKTICLRGT